jgi:peptide/nickel transport system permease protein
VAGGAILVCILGAALAAPWLAPYPPNQQSLLERRQPPSPKHPFGLDEVGRDILSRILHGARLSLGVGLAAVALALGVGGALGAVAGYRGGWVDGAVSSIMDVMQAFPSLLLAIALIAILGPGLANALLAVAITAIPTYARLMRVGVLTARQQEYVVAARAVGVPTGRLLWRHILPACLTPLRVQALLGIGIVILEVAGLSFLGLGAQPPAPEWGAMLGEGRGAVFAAPHIVLFPGFALLLAVLGINLLGDGLQEAAERRPG